MWLKLVKLQKEKRILEFLTSNTKLIDNTFRKVLIMSQRKNWRLNRLSQDLKKHKSSLNPYYFQCIK